MARFDVYTFKGRAPLVVDMQAELLARIGSRVIIPLLPSNSKTASLPRLMPTVILGGAEYQLVTTDLVAVPFDRLGALIGNLEDRRQIIVDAIDFLMQGF
jgi:toxin CcdB